METVLVGLDEYDEPLQWTVDYGRVMRSELVGVVAFRPHDAETPPDWYDEQLASARKDAEAAVDRAASAIPHRSEIRDGDPRTVIEQAAEDTGAALVVVGRRGSGGFHGLGLGSVAHHLEHHLRVPLA